MSIQSLTKQIQHQDVFAITDVHTLFTRMRAEGFTINKIALDVFMRRETIQTVESDGTIRGS